MKTLSIVGGGVVGLSCALRAAESGWQVTIYDANRGDAASAVAAGMLGIAGESRTGEDTYLRFAERAMRRWPAFLERLGDRRVVAAGSSVMAGADSADVGELAMVANWLGDRGHRVKPLTGKQIRDLEPALSTRIRSGFLAASEMAVDNRRLLSVLGDAVADLGVRRVAGEVLDLGNLPGDQVLLTGGVASVKLWPGLPVHPSKGEVLRLGWARGALPPPEHVVRGLINGRPVYIVPRAEGVVVGATQYDGDADLLPVAGGVADLLGDAIELMPALREYRLLSADAGLRPLTPDGLPIVGRLDDRVVAATGHGRNGILMSAITGELVAKLLAGNEIDEPAIDPRRFS